MKSKINNLKNRIKKTKSNSLKVKVWMYMMIFTILILSLLWLFQIIFLNTFYEGSKINEIEASAISIKSVFKNDYMDLTYTLDDLSRDSGICIQVVINDLITYDSSTFNRGCLGESNIKSYKSSFIDSLKDEENYKVINPRYNNEVLIKAVKLNDSTYVFLSSSLQPLDSAIGILRKQLIIITIILFFLSFLIAYYISRRISKPIEDINESAKKMASGDYEIKFEIDDDIYELNELVETLNKTSDDLAKTETLRRELMANVSHDLKTPLTMIKAYAEMVRDLTYNNKEKREENLNVIIDESNRLNALVNDILDLSIIQSGNINLNCEEFDLKIVVDSIMKRYDYLKDTYKFEVNSSNQVMVYGDIQRIEQVIYNLVNNAVNYVGEDKKVLINIIEFKNEVKLEVTDNGKGISEDDLKLIFKKYYKVDRSHRRDKVGTGIGLSIVENILKEHKFKYGVNSKIGKGTTFWFILPKNK